MAQSAGSDRTNYSSKTGDAPIIRQGHTASPKFGSDPNLKVRGNDTPRDLTVK